MLIPVALPLVATLLAGVGVLSAQPIAVPNGSFESPTPPPGFPATPQVDIWQKAPQPPGVPLPGGITWDQLAGVFVNTPSTSPDHIDNVDGNQAAYVFAIPGVSLFQQVNSTFTVGNAYQLTVGLLGGGGITEGSSFQLSLYYVDAANNRVALGSTPIVYSAGAFSNPTHLYDYTVNVSTVHSGDAAAGKSIGIELLSTFGTGAGYWDLDNVRLAAVPEPGATALIALAGAGLIMARWRAGRRKRSRPLV